MPSVERIPVRLTLVSSSPRRQELLSEAGYQFEVFPSRVHESWTEKSPAKIAEMNARRKVERSFYFGDGMRLLVGGDTIVAIEDRTIGKPAGADSARRMLAALSGKRHSVITGICLSGPSANDSSEPISDSGTIATQVTFRKISDAEIQAYLQSGEWKGKAGAYGIQGSARNFVESYEGDYQNIVGFPIALFHDLLSRSFGHCEILR